MNKFLISTALVASMGFATGAFAQAAPIYEWTVITTAAVPANLGADGVVGGTGVNADTAAVPAVLTTYYGTLDQFNTASASNATAALVGPANVDETNSLAGNQQSLLQDLLAKADTIQSSLANTSENLGNINGSINLDMTRFDAALPDVVAGTSTNGATISEPITAKIGNLTTTVIGSLGTGDISSTANLSSIQNLNQAMTNTSQALNAQFTNGPTGAAPAGLQQIYNLSSNLGALDASVNIDLKGVSLASADNIPGVLSTNATINSIDSKMATISTTAIGSLGDGKVTSTLTNNATALTERLVGSN